MKYVVAVIVLVVLLASPVWAKKADKTFGSVRVEKLISVYDGDTFRCDIAGWPDIAGKNIGVRIYGIDTPEKRGTTGRVKTLARMAQRLTEKMLKQARVVELRDVRRGKYFRIVADVYVDGKRLADVLMKNGLAKPYDGGTKTAW